MQIKLAKLRRDLTQAKEKVRLTKKGEQPGFMGLGAYEADVYFESVKKEVHTIRRKLRKIRGKRVLHRDRRAELGFTSISLAGYTKAGKSSLFNALTQENVPVDAQLFTTLSTTTRLITVNNKEFLLTDTVGFIDRLPLTLMEAFQSTLEETIYSDLILLLVDASEPLPKVIKKLTTCIETIERIGAAGIPTITLLNKTDLISQEELEEKTEALKEKATTLIPISALRKTNLDQIREEILKILKNYVQASFTISLSKETRPFMAWLYRNTDVKKAEYNENSVHVIFESSPTTAEKVRSRVEREFKGKVERL
jgi:GTP-binding protein HflX